MADKKTGRYDGENGIETYYCLTFDEVMQGFAAAEKVKRNPQRVVGTAVLVLCSVMLSSTFGTPIMPFGIVMELIIFYMLYRTWYLPLLRRRKVAKSIAAKKATYRIVLFESGIRVVEAGENHDIRYRDLSCYAAGQCMLLVAQGQMIIVPNHYWNERLPEAVARLQQALGERYRTIEEKRVRDLLKR